jgi:3-(3-hydroxy-phenyl)propionate hydroxylase
MTCPDAPHGDGFILDHLGGGFTLLALGCEAQDVVAHGLTAQTLNIAAPSGALTKRYLGDAACGVFLIRPDQHVVARWSAFDPAASAAALARAIGKA